jgi:restriction system protein
MEGVSTVAHRRGAFEDLVGAASWLPWRISLILAVASGLLLHLLAVSLKPPRALVPSDLGGVAAGALLATGATFLQWIVPLIFLFAAILAYTRRSRAISLFESSRDDALQRIQDMSWSEFELLTGELFRRRGYTVSENGSARPDGGVDLVLTKNSQRTLVQCKHWKARSVGVKIIRELQGVIAAEGADDGYVVTSGVFTLEAHRFASSCKVALIDGAALRALIQELDSGNIPRSAQSGAASSALAPALATDPLCPNCGSTMIVRVAKRGPNTGNAFWGCPKFPTCRGTKPRV